MEFDTATIKGLMILALIIVMAVIWLISRQEPQEYPRRKRWRYER